MPFEITKISVRTSIMFQRPIPDQTIFFFFKNVILKTERGKANKINKTPLSISFENRASSTEMRARNVACTLFRDSEAI